MNILTRTFNYCQRRDVNRWNESYSI